MTGYKLLPLLLLIQCGSNFSKIYICCFYFYSVLFCSCSVATSECNCNNGNLWQLVLINYLPKCRTWLFSLSVLRTLHTLCLISSTPIPALHLSFGSRCVTASCIQWLVFTCFPYAFPT